MRFPKLRIQKLIAALLLFPSIGSAVDGQVSVAPPKVQQKHFIENAIQVSITPRGMGFFSTGLNDVLEAQGLSLEQGYFGGFEWKADKSYSINDLSLSEEQRNMLTMIKNLLSKWLVGFTFNDFRPTVQVGDLGYVASFNKFALYPDRALLQKLGKKTGAVLAIEMEIKEMTAMVDQVRVSDQNNPFIGTIGIDGVGLKIGSSTNPLKVRLPFYIRINDNQELEFQAVNFESNLDSVDMELKYKKLLVPKVVVEVNGHRFEMNEKQLESEFQERLPQILQEARGFLKKFASEQLPGILNEKSKEMLKGTLEELNYMDPVGADRDPCLPPPVPLVWGITPQKDGLSDNGSLQIKLNAFVEDSNRPYLSITPSLNAKGTLSLNRVNPADYDIALAIDRGFINRMLQLSYLRGVFNGMAIDKTKPNGPKMDLTRQPEFQYVATPVGAPQAPGITYLKMVTTARIHKGFLQGMKQKAALKEPFEVDLAVVVKMMKDKYGQILLYYYGIDANSVNIKPEYLTGIGSLFDGTVRKEAIAALEQVAADWRATNALVSGDPLPIPTEVGGIRLEPQTISFDPSGHLVMYMTYAKPGSPLPPVKPPQKCEKKVGGGK